MKTDWKKLATELANDIAWLSEWVEYHDTHKTWGACPRVYKAWEARRDEALERVISAQERAYGKRK